MPRPTAAQLAYGSCTVILCSLAMLLLSAVGSPPPVAVIIVITAVSLALGVAVAVTTGPVQGRRTSSASRPERLRDTVPAPAAAPVREHVGH